MQQSPQTAYQGQLMPTPLVEVRLFDDSPAIWCKLEFLNPSGSTKDRLANYILTKALRQHDVELDGWVVEASSGSTSIAMALTCAQLGLRFAAVMLEGVSNERVLMIRSYGSEVVFTPREQGLHGAMATAEQLAESRGAFLPQQFSNADNPASHRYETAREIIRQLLSGNINAVVSAVGTSGTLVVLYQGFVDFGRDVKPFAAKPTTTGGALSEVECCSFSSRIPGVVDGLSKIYRDAGPSRVVGGRRSGDGRAP